MVTIHDAIAIAITADGTKAKAEFAAVGKSAKTHLDATAKSSSGLSSTLTKVGVGAAVAGAAIGAGLFKAADAASRAQIEHEKLLNTIQRSPQLVGASVAAFEKQQRAIQNSTVVDDEAVAGLQSLLGNFKLTQSQILQLTPLVVDLSRKFGVDLNTAGTAVGKAFSTGAAKGLKQFGIDAKLSADPTERLAQLTDLLGKKAGGFANQEGKTFSGQLQIAKNKMGDLEEAIGAGALPVISKLADIAGGVANKFTELNDATDGNAGAFLAYGAAGLVAVGTLSAVAGQVGNAKDAVVGAVGWIGKLIAAHTAEAVSAEAAAVAEGELAAARASGGAAGLVGALGALGPAAIVAGAAIGTAAIAVRLLDKENGRAAASADKLTKATKEYGSTLKEEAGAAINKWLASHEKEASVLKASGVSYRQYADAVEYGGKKKAEVNKALDDAIKKLESEHRAGKVSTQEYYKQGAALQTLKDTLHDSSAERYNAEKATRKAADEEKRAAKITDESKSARDRARDAAKKFVKALEAEKTEAKKASDHLYDLVHATQELHDKQRAASEVGLDYADAIQEVKDRQKDYNDAVKEHGKNSDEAAQAQRDLQRAMNNVGAVAEEGAVKIVDAAKAAARGRDDTLAYRNSIAEAAKSLEPGSPIRVYLEGLIAKFDALNGKRIAVTIEAKYEDKGFPIGGGVKVKALGGPVHAGEPYIVGEVGPELFVPKSSGTIIPNNKLTAARAHSGIGGGAGTVVHVGQVVVRANSPRELEDALARAFRNGYRIPSKAVA